MKRIFLSLPMSGRSDEEVNAEYFKMVDNITTSKIFGDEELIFDWNFDYVPKKNASPVVTEPLLYLGHAIQKMAYCDGVYFGEGWTRARGCQIEREVAYTYGMPCYIYDFIKRKFIEMEGDK